jgi:hypothetical protein
MFCRGMLEGDIKSNSDTASSQPAISKDDTTDDNIRNNDSATYPRIPLEEGITDAAPAANPIATPSTTIPSTTPAAGGSRLIADAIITAGDKHAALLRDLVEQFSSSRQVHML